MLLAEHEPQSQADPPLGSVAGSPPRPRTVTGRWRSRAVGLYVNRRRLGLSLAAGIVAAAATAVVLTGRVSSIATPAESAPTTSTPPADVASGRSQADRLDGPKVIPADMRLLALDRDSLRLPVAIDDELEILGLIPEVEAMRSEVVTEQARVLASTDDAVLVLVSRDEAHRAAEIEAVGRLVVLGRTSPSLTDDDS